MEQQQAQHPAAEIVAIALKKIISKSDPKRHQDIIDECNQFLAGIHQIIPAHPPAATPGQQQQQQKAGPDAVGQEQGSTQAHGNVGEAGKLQEKEHAPRPAQTSAGEQGTQQQQEQNSQSEERASDTKAEGASHAQAQASPDPAHAPSASSEQQPEAEGSKPPTQATAIPAAYSLAPRTPAALPDAVCSRVLTIMQRAGDTGKAQVIEVVLDCLQKLVAFSFLQGAVYALDVTAQDALDAGVRVFPCKQTPRLLP